LERSTAIMTNTAVANEEEGNTETHVAGTMKAPRLDMGVREFEKSIASDDEDNDKDNNNIDDDNSNRDNSNQDDTNEQDNDSQEDDDQEKENGGSDDSGDDNRGFGKENAGCNGQQKELPVITQAMTNYARKNSWDGNARNVSISSASNGRGPIPKSIGTNFVISQPSSSSFSTFGNSTSDAETIKQLKEELDELKKGEKSHGMSGKKFFQSAMGKAVINWAKRTLFPKLKFMPTGGEHDNGNLWTQVLPNCYQALTNVRDDGERQSFRGQFVRGIQHGLAQKRNNVQQDLKTILMGGSWNRNWPLPC